jgi:hypothetical protein
MVGSVGEPDLLEELPGAPLGLPGRTASEERREFDVLLGSELVHEVKRLEDEADLVASQLGEGTFGELIDAPAVQPQLAGRRAVKTAEQVEERRFPTAARPPHGHGLTTGDLQVDSSNGANEPLTFAIVLA